MKSDPTGTSSIPARSPPSWSDHSELSATSCLLIKFVVQKVGPGQSSCRSLTDSTDLRPSVAFPTRLQDLPANPLLPFLLHSFPQVPQGCFKVPNFPRGSESNPNCSVCISIQRLHLHRMTARTPLFHAWCGSLPLRLSRFSSGNVISHLFSTLSTS